MQYCLRLVLPFLLDVPSAGCSVVDVGSMDVNGCYRPLFSDSRMQYIGVDLEPGPNVDVVLADPYTLPFDDGAVNLVISGQMLEHCERFWRVFHEMLRVVKDD